jgi:hypothetical protein
MPRLDDLRRTQNSNLTKTCVERACSALFTPFDRCLTFTKEEEMFVTTIIAILFFFIQSLAATPNPWCDELRKTPPGTLLNDPLLPSFTGRVYWANVTALCDLLPTLQEETIFYNWGSVRNCMVVLFHFCFFKTFSVFCCAFCSDCEACATALTAACLVVRWTT